MTEAEKYLICSECHEPVDEIQFDFIAGTVTNDPCGHRNQSSVIGGIPRRPEPHPFHVGGTF